MPVYLIRAGESGPVKIGYSECVEGRMSKMQADNHERLTILRVWEGGETEEAFLHAQFADLNIHGEWFGFSRLMLGDVGLIEVEPPEPDPIVPVADAPPSQSRFGERLIMARKAMRLTQRDIATHTGVSPGAVAQWELYDKQPRLHRIQQIAALLNVSTDWLLSPVDAPASA